MLPYIDMRGIPAERYQGNVDLLSELEMRWDVVQRWSVMAYAGAGKAFNEWNEFAEANWAWSYGTGFVTYLPGNSNCGWVLMSHMVPIHGHTILYLAAIG